MQAPQELVASTEGPQTTECRTKLTWNAVAGALEYRIYRYAVTNGSSFYFYLTQKQPAATYCSGNEAQSCTQDAECAAGGWGTCIGSYIELGDSNDPERDSADST